MKKCQRCKQEKSLHDYPLNRSKPGGLSGYCKECSIIYRRQYYTANIERLRQKTRDWHNENKDKRDARYVLYREKIFDHYGRVCSYCGSDSNLQIDHIDGNGKAHRKSIGIKSGGGTALYLWLIRNNFPNGFQVLCKYCNYAKGNRSEQDFFIWIKDMYKAISYRERM